MKKVKIINNVDAIVGFQLDPLPQSLRILPRRGAFLNITEEELDYIHVNQNLIQKGLIWIDDQEIRVNYGLEKPTGEKLNVNVLQYEEIVKLVNGHHKTLEKALSKIDEKAILLQFVEAARESKLDSKIKIDMIEAKVNVEIFPDED